MSTEDKYVIELSAKGFQTIEEAKEDLGLKENEDLVDIAIALLRWALNKSKLGEEIGSIKEDAHVTKIEVEPLEILRKKHLAKNNIKIDENNA